MSPRLVLASSSTYRRQLLGRFGLRFEAVSPDIDERPLDSESVSSMVERLSLYKAQALASRYPDALIIGSDQAAELDGNGIGKPGTRERAREQLLAVAGRAIVFHTGVCVLDARTGIARTRLVPTTVEFLPNPLPRIEAYLDQENALDCAGSFKSEGLGIALCRRIDADDPTALVGLPLIALAGLLASFGVVVPSPN